jgi:hypothetical protein
MWIHNKVPLQEEETYRVGITVVDVTVDIASDLAVRGTSARQQRP